MKKPKIHRLNTDGARWAFYRTMAPVKHYYAGIDSRRSSPPRAIFCCLPFATVNGRPNSTAQFYALTDTQLLFRLAALQHTDASSYFGCAAQAENIKELRHAMQALLTHPANTQPPRLAPHLQGSQLFSRLFGRSAG